MQPITKPITITQQIIKYPPCYPYHYQDDCKECAKPLILKSPKGPLSPCDGTIYWCQFAQGSSIWKSCTHFSLQKYACTHGGSTCSNCARKWSYYHFGITPPKQCKQSILVMNKKIVKK